MATRALILKTDASGSIITNFLFHGKYEEVIAFLAQINTTERIDWLISGGDIDYTMDNAYPSVQTYRDQLEHLWVDRNRAPIYPKVYPSFEDLIKILQKDKVPDIELIYILSEKKIIVYEVDWGSFGNNNVIEYKRSYLKSIFHTTHKSQ